jgi:signal transduction histidine kinase
MEERGTVVLRTRIAPAENAIIAEVSDEGHGIPRSEVTKIFEPFYTTKPPGRGTGLGLSICYGIIADHGGRIDVDSAAGRGSVFRITLPIASGAV